MKELLIKLSDDALSPAEARQLNDLLRGDPLACEVYLNQITLEAQLQRELAGDSRQQVEMPFQSLPLPVSTMRGKARFRLTRAWLAAAAMIALGTVLWHFLASPRTSLPVATVLFAEDCEWRSPGGIAEGDRLPAAKVHLLHGTAILRFDGGAEMVLSGETVLELESARRASLRSGDVIVRAEGESAGFILDTPASTLTDLGTEFAVKVSRSGATELHVNEGEVGYALGELTSVLKQGEALRLERSKQPVSITPSAPRFAQVLQQAKPRERRDLMTVYEGFHYEEGSYAPKQITKGKGWAGPWRLRLPGEQRNVNETDSATDMRISHGRLTVPWPIPGGRLGGLEMPAGRAFRIREMQEPVAMNRNGITYFSLMTQEPERTPKRGQSTPQESVRITFRSSADYWGEALSFGLSADQRPVVNNGLGVWMQSVSRVPDGRTLLWVGKILRRASGEDEVSFRVYDESEPLDYAEPGSWHLVTRNLRMDAALDLVVLSSTGSAARIVDEIRIGPTWRSVVPIQEMLTAFAAPRDEP